MAANGLHALTQPSWASGLILSRNAEYGHVRDIGPRHMPNALYRLASAPATGTLVSKQDPSTEFSYAMGGRDWPGLCETGRTQSPINIVPGTGSYSQLALQMLPKLNFGTGKNVVVINTGHAIQVQWEMDEPPTASVSLGALVGLSNNEGPIDVPFGSGRVRGMGADQLSVTPLQFHFHSPSEHTINGKLSAAEAHLVTRISSEGLPACSEKGCLAVFGTLYDYANDECETSAFLAPLLNHIPESQGRVNAVRMPSDYQLNFADFFPTGHNLVTYSGSLTTPPCSSNALWTVFLDTKTISNQQALALQDSMALQEGEPHCSPVSEDIMLQVSAFRADAAQETGSADSTGTDNSTKSGSKAATDDNAGMGPTRYSVCDGQRFNNRSLQLRNGRAVGIYTSQRTD